MSSCVDLVRTVRDAVWRDNNGHQPGHRRDCSTISEALLWLQERFPPRRRRCQRWLRRSLRLHLRLRHQGLQFPEAVVTLPFALPSVYLVLLVPIFLFLLRIYA